MKKKEIIWTAEQKVATEVLETVKKKKQTPATKESDFWQNIRK